MNEGKQQQPSDTHHHLPPHPHTQHNAICLETQHYPDAINQNPLHFPSVILRQGETYKHKTIFTFDAIA